MLSQCWPLRAYIYTFEVLGLHNTNKERKTLHESVWPYRAELSGRNKKGKKYEQKKSGVTLLLTGDGGLTFVWLYLTHEGAIYSFHMYLHPKQVLYRHPDRRKWRTHGSVCEPRNNTLRRQREGRKKEELSSNSDAFMTNQRFFH